MTTWWVIDPYRAEPSATLAGPPHGAGECPPGGGIPGFARANRSTARPDRGISGARPAMSRGGPAASAHRPPPSRPPRDRPIRARRAARRRPRAPREPTPAGGRGAARFGVGRAVRHPGRRTGRSPYWCRWCAGGGRPGEPARREAQTRPGRWAPASPRRASTHGGRPGRPRPWGAGARARCAMGLRRVALWGDGAVGASAGRGTGPVAASRARPGPGRAAASTARHGPHGASVVICANLAGPRRRAVRRAPRRGAGEGAARLPRTTATGTVGPASTAGVARRRRGRECQGQGGGEARRPGVKG